MKKFFLLLAMLMPASALGQISVWSEPILNQLGQPIPQATVAVCSGQPSQVIPCGGTLLATIYFSFAGGGQINPLYTDSFGRASIFATPGNYWLQIYGAGISTQIIPITIGGGGGGGGSGTVNTGTLGYAGYYASSTNAITPIGDLFFAGGGIVDILSGLNIGAIGTTPTACSLTTGCIASNESTVSGTPTANQQYCHADALTHLRKCSYNGSPEVTEVPNSSAVIVTPDFNFSACVSGCAYAISGATTLVAGANTITLTPVPLGVNGTDIAASFKNHYLWITPAGGDSSPPEPFLITGGTAVSGAASGTLTFSAGYSHIAGYTIGSASTGIAEADSYAAALPSSLAFPGTTVKLMSGASYTCLAPIYLFNAGGQFTFDGQWATITHASIANCLIGYAQTADISHVVMQPLTAPWNVSPSSPSSIPNSSPTATVIIPTCPSGFYANIPGQRLWLAGATNGQPSTIYGIGEYVTTVTGGTCTPGLANGTVVITQSSVTLTNLSLHDAGYTLSSNVGAYIEAGGFINEHIHDNRFHSNGAGHGEGNLVEVDQDQACAIDNMNMDAGYLTRKDADFQSAGIAGYTPGARCHVGPNVNISEPATCVNWMAGNDFIWDEGVCQNYTAGGVMIRRRLGGFGAFKVGNVHFETGGLTPPWQGSVSVGNPAAMFSNPNKPVTMWGDNAGQPAFGGNEGPWPTFASLAAQTATQYYYLVAHNNLGTGCTSGGDCISAPIFIGAAQTTDPSANNVTVNWYAWGDYSVVPPCLGCQISTYDLLRVSSTSGTLGVSIPQAPTGTVTVAAATGLVPSTVCNTHAICAFTDNVAPGSLTSYTVNSGASKPFYPPLFYMPGVVALEPSSLSPAFYSGPPNCINSSGYLRDGLIADFVRHSADAEGDLAVGCPWIVAPIASKGYGKACYTSASPAVCSASNITNYSTGSVALAAGTTTLTVQTAAVTPYSRITITENSGLGTLLGVTCNVTAGRSYLVTPTPGVGFVITSSAAPTTNPACLDFKVDNGS